MLAGIDVTVNWLFSCLNRREHATIILLTLHHNEKIKTLISSDKRYLISVHFIQCCHLNHLLAFTIIHWSLFRRIHIQYYYLQWTEKIFLPIKSNKICDSLLKPENFTMLILNFRALTAIFDDKTGDISRFHTPVLITIFFICNKYFLFLKEKNGIHARHRVISGFASYQGASYRGSGVLGISTQYASD